MSFRHPLRSIPLVTFAAFAASALPLSAINITPAEITLGLVIDDGRADLFDDFGSLQINATSYNAPTTGFPPSYVGQEQVIDGLTITGQLVGLSTSGGAFPFADPPIVRWWYRLANPTNAPIIVPVTLPSPGEMGSDNNTLVNATSSGDLVFDASDFWVVSSDGANGANDPAFGFAFSSLAAPVKPPTANLVGDAYTINFGMVTVPANSTISLVYFGASRVFTGPAPSGKSTVAEATSLIESIFLATGQVNQDFLSIFPFGPLSEIRNLDFAAGPTPPAPPEPTPAPVKLSIKGKTKISTGKSSVTLSGKLTGGSGVARLTVKIGKAKPKTVKVSANGSWKSRIKVPVGKTLVRVGATVGTEKVRPTAVRITRR